MFFFSLIVKHPIGSMTYIKIIICVINSSVAIITFEE